MEDCEICKYSEVKDSLIFKSKYWRVNLANDQYYLGRSYITLNRHLGDLADLSEEEILDFLEVVKKIENAIRKAFKAEVFNWCCLMNNAYQAQVPKPHVHWHLRPRYRNKIDFEGESWEDKEFGKHYERKTSRIVSEEMRTKIMKKIKEDLD